MRRLKRKFPLARACCRGENDDDDDDDNDDKQRKWIGESGMRNRETWSSASLIDPELSTSTAWKKTRRSSVVLLLESCAIISSHTLCSALLSVFLHSCQRWTKEEGERSAAAELDNHSVGRTTNSPNGLGQLISWSDWDQSVGQSVGQTRYLLPFYNVRNSPTHWPALLLCLPGRSLGRLYRSIVKS